MTLSQKTKIASVLLSAAVLFSACQQTEFPNEPENLDPTDIVYATIEDPADTRTYLDGKKVLWSSEDEIVVFKGNTLPLKYVVSANSVGTTEGYFKKDAEYELLGPSSPISHNIAFYPFAELICKAEGESYVLENLSLPSVQTYVADSFDPGSFPMMAVSADTDDVDFRFKNLCGVLKLQLQGEGTIASITVKGNSDEILAGSASLTMSHGGIPAISIASDGAKEVTLDCGEGVVLNADAPTSFLISLLPTDFTNGFTVTVSDSRGGSMEYSTTKQNSILRSAILRMPVKEYIGERQPQEGDYIDEYGVNHGQGVEIDGVVWASVNCGYHKDDFKYGKLYQWGRKYGQGYSGELYDVNGNIVGTYSDATVPTIESGPVSLSEGQSESNSNVFYISSGNYNLDWIYPKDGTLWNFGSEDNPVKTEYDPCPEGWRVPTRAELDELRSNGSSWTTDENGQVGYWFSGTSVYTVEVPQVFFPAAGSRFDSDADASVRGCDGYYWSSRPGYSNASTLGFYSGFADMYSYSRAYGASVRCVQDDSELTPVASVTLDRSFLTMETEQTYTLSATITPSNANHQSAHWWSDDESVAVVDHDGKVTALSAGTATITAMAGMQVATCEVTVTAASENKDYIDEYGVNHGQGIKIGETVWAPVNCGYHKDDFKYGKLYQWGRKYGQGYSGPLYDVNGSKVDTYSDATVPMIESGPVSLATGQSESNSNVFYTSASDYNYDWSSSQNDKLWNSGTEEEPIKTEYDPCPEGWRVPTYAELDELYRNKSSWATNSAGQVGYWFSGANAYTSEVAQVFLPAAGGRHSHSGVAYSRGYYGIYRSSSLDYSRSYYLNFGSSILSLLSSNRAYGYSVRCVQVTD